MKSKVLGALPNKGVVLEEKEFEAFSDSRKILGFISHNTFIPFNRAFNQPPVVLIQGGFNTGADAYHHVAANVTLTGFSLQTVGGNAYYGWSNNPVDGLSYVALGV